MYKSIELFSGCGGLALGLERAGFHHIMLIDKDKDACNTIIQNRPYWNVVHADIKKTDFTPYDVDLISGGFPCQSFSYATDRPQGLEDTRGTLFYEFARAVDIIKPKVFLFENVRGLLTHDKGRTLSTIIGVLENSGYNIAEPRILNAVDYTVPQKRERVFVVGTRKDLNLVYTYPEPIPVEFTVRDALENVPESIGTVYSEEKKRFMELIPEGGNWRSLPKDLQKEYMGKAYYASGGRTTFARRLAWDKPCLTLTCSPAQKKTERCHPGETRPLTVREYARIQTFPDDWQFTGSLTSQYRQIGNAVPVNLAFFIGQSLKECLDGK